MGTRFIQKLRKLKQFKIAFVSYVFNINDRRRKCKIKNKKTAKVHVDRKILKRRLIKQINI